MSRHQDPKFEIVKVENVEVIRTTDKAILVATDDGDEVWLPSALLKGKSVDTKGQKGDLYIPRCLAEEKDFEYLEDY